MNNLNFKITFKHENWAHIQLIADLGLRTDSLSPSVIKQMYSFNAQYVKAIGDNDLDDKEFKRLSEKSKAIAQQIKTENPTLFQEKKSGAGFLAVLGGLGLLAGAIIGIKNLK